LHMSHLEIRVWNIPIAQAPATQGDAPKEPGHYRICGHIGHTCKEHQEECLHCDESHPAGECPTSEVTCFLCEGNDHVPAQCRLYPMVPQVNQQVKDGLHQALNEPHEDTRSKSKDEARSKSQKSLPYITTKCCYSCGEEGHFSRDCSKKRRRFTEVEIE